MSIPEHEQRAVFAARLKLQSAVQCMRQAQTLLEGASKSLESVGILDLDLPVLQDHITRFCDGVESTKKHIETVYK
jgi:hypothetical protein